MLNIVQSVKRNQIWMKIKATAGNIITVRKLPPSFDIN